MLSRKKILIFCQSVLAFLFFLFLKAVSPCYATDNATFFFTTSILPKNIFAVKLFVNSPFQPVNTVHVVLSYDSSKLNLTNIDFAESLFPNVVERSGSTPGSVTITAFTIDPFTGNQGLIATLEFQTREAGTANIAILDESTIHLGDGSGKNIFDSDSDKSMSLNVNRGNESVTATNSNLNSSSPENYQYKDFQFQTYGENQQSSYDEQAPLAAGITDYTVNKAVTPIIPASAAKAPVVRKSQLVLILIGGVGLILLIFVILRKILKI